MRGVLDLMDGGAERDIDRHVELAELGWRIVGVSSDRLRYRREVIVERTRGSLACRNWTLGALEL